MIFKFQQQKNENESKICFSLSALFVEFFLYLNFIVIKINICNKAKKIYFYSKNPLLLMHLFFKKIIIFISSMIFLNKNSSQLE